uniref:Uncharacterized protein n=1 Tax=Vespula pensylvanica TaxID=30213 RepID=A0A834NYC7_VESPE|nr:hypothetical protein H0235_009372 [Vespula pensylvanica]
MEEARSAAAAAAASGDGDGGDGDGGGGGGGCTYGGGSGGGMREIAREIILSGSDGVPWTNEKDYDYESNSEGRAEKI